jgi:hypothetical protein
MQRPVDPEVRQVGPEGAEALRREVEVERLRQLEEGYSSDASAWKSVSGLKLTPRRSSQRARPPVAYTRVAASDAQ